MKVKDLIDLLQKENPESNVVIYTDYDYTSGNQEFKVTKEKKVSNDYPTIVLTAYGDWV